MKVRIEYTVTIDKAMRDKLADRADRMGFSADTNNDLVRALLRECGESELYRDHPDEKEDGDDE